jgi:YD repeat-containing protein
VRFQRRGADGQFIDAITDAAERPSLAALEADYAAAQAAHSLGADRTRVTTRAFDAANSQLRETEQSNSLGAVTTRNAYDRHGNKILDVSAAGLAGLENAVSMRYGAANHVIEVSSGPFKHRNAAGAEVTASAVESFSYDARGNQSTHTDARGYAERFHFDAQNRLASHWDGRLATPGAADSTLRTDHVYDSFDRLIGQRQPELVAI